MKPFNNETIISRPSRYTYVGVFLVAYSTLLYEILLTRIFSVTMWYHFAFVAISLALFGMSVGAVIVYVFPDYFQEEKIHTRLGVSALWFALTMVLSFLAHLAMPFTPARSLAGISSVALTYTILSIPFIFSGVCISLALTKFPRHIGKLYAADLIGAALGCLGALVVFLFTDGPTAIVFAALLAAAGSLCFSYSANHARLRTLDVIAVVLLGAASVILTAFAHAQYPLLRPLWVKGGWEPRALYEKWNSFSRVQVSGNPDVLQKPFGWGMSSTYPAERKVRQLYVTIDASAGTVLTAYDGVAEQLEHLKYDITNLAHYLKKDARVLVVGAGGGRDVLSALAFNQQHVTAVEINGDILATVNGRFGDFTGHLDKNPRITFVQDEARSYLARQKETYDIIQISLIDTWAATAAGAYTLSENTLYTKEAWKIFLDRLAPGGILSVSRWYFRDKPAEMYRLEMLAHDALQSAGVANPQENMLMVRYLVRQHGGNDIPQGVGTLLVSKEPFSSEDIAVIEQIAAVMHFEIVQSPRFSLDDQFRAIASASDSNAVAEQYPLDISAPADNRPFFFHMLRPGNVFRGTWWKETQINTKAVLILAVLFLVVTVLTLLCIIVPLLMTHKRMVFAGSIPYFIFFTGIGLGFMLVEISQMQRLIVFLGHPTYALSAVLFTLLLAAGMGSYITESVKNAEGAMSDVGRLLVLLLLLLVFGFGTSYITHAFAALSTGTRVAIAVGMLFPLGFSMGAAFPLGMRLASMRVPSLTPWFWGINGATSVVASVLAVIVALGWGISTAYWTGALCYIVAIASFFYASKKMK